MDYSPLSRKQGLESSGYGCWEWKGILDFYDCNDLISSSQVSLLRCLLLGNIWTVDDVASFAAKVIGGDSTSRRHTELLDEFEQRRSKVWF